jgi:hypothetical protein
LTEPITFNKSFRKGCPISPTVFNISINQIVTEWKEEEIKWIQISRNTDENTIFADDQFIVADLEDALKIYIHTMETVTSKEGLKISTSIKTTTAFKGPDPMRSKIAIKDNIMEKNNHF